MAAARVFKQGDLVRATAGKHANQIGTVEHSDKSITTVRFGELVDPVWTANLIAENSNA